MLEKIGKLPAHPLIVHLPIVLGPLLGLLTLALLVPAWRTKLIKPAAGLAVLFAISTIVAAESGEKLAATLRLGKLIADHAEAAETLRTISIVLAVVLVIAAGLWGRLRPVFQTGAVVIVALIGVATIGYTIKTGEAGAKQVWEAKYQSALEAGNGGSSGSDSGASDEDRSGDDDGR